MAETSGLWTTNAAPAGDQVVSYTQSLASTMLRIAAACSGFEGVAPGYLSELAPSSTGVNNCRIASGGAMVDGKYYSNSANVDFNIVSSAGGTTRIDRIVIKALWGATFTCRLTLVSGADAAPPSVPALDTTSETDYDIPICQVLVTAGGVITITDERRWAVVDTDESTLEDNAGLLRVKDLGITTAKINDLAVTTGKIAADAVTTAKIPNRTRRFLVPAEARSITVEQWLSRGLTLADGVYGFGYGAFYLPDDYVSGLTISAIIVGGATGNVLARLDYSIGAAGEDFDTHASANADATAALTIDKVTKTYAQDISASVNAGDYISLDFRRDGAGVADTINADVYIYGFLVEYTADS